MIPFRCAFRRLQSVLFLLDAAQEIAQQLRHGIHFEPAIGDHIRDILLYGGGQNIGVRRLQLLRVNTFHRLANTGHRGSKAGNRGWSAAQSAIEMAALMKQLD